MISTPPPSLRFSMIDYTSYRLEDAGNTLVLEVTGRLDSMTSGFLLDCIQGLIENGEKRVVLDLADLQTISSEGLAVLVRANTRLKKLGGKIALASVGGTVADVLRLVHFDRLFGLYPDVDEAAQAIAS